MGKWFRWGGPAAGLFGSGRPPSAGAPPLNSLEFLAREWLAWESSPRRREQLLGELYYRGEQKILSRKRTVIGPEGMPVEVANLPNARLTDNQYARMLDQKLDYLLGRPPALETEDNTYRQALQAMLGPGFFRTLRALGHDALAGGCGWLAPWWGEDGLRLRRFAPWEVLPFWEDGDHTRLEAALRVYRREEYGARGRETGQYAELYTPQGVYRFRREGGRLVKDAPFRAPYLWAGAGGSRKPLAWGRLPLIPWKSGPEELPLLNRVKSLQDAVNLILSSFVNGMQEDPRNTILVLVNYDGQNLGEFRRNLAAYGAVKVRSDAGAPGGDVRTLSLEVNGENYRAVLELLKRALVENARGYDARDLRAAGTPNEMNLRSVFSDMDLDANRMEAEFQASFQELLYFFNLALKAAGRGDFTGRQAELIFNRDTIVNESQVIQDVKNSQGLLSQETLVAQHPWVKDVSAELARLADSGR